MKNILYSQFCGVFLTLMILPLGGNITTIHCKESLVTSSDYLKWGTQGTGPGQFYEPDGIATSPDGNIYVVDQLNDRIQWFTPNGEFLGTWGITGSGIGQFMGPRGIAIDASGYVYVVDEDLHRVQKFTLSGDFVTSWGSEGSGTGEFSSPAGIAVDGNSIYIIDTYNHRIQKFTSNGTYISRWGAQGADNGQFNLPYAAAVDTSGYLYVADRWNHRIQKFASDGEFVTAWSNSFYGPRGVAVSSEGKVYVTDSGYHRVQVFDTNGVFLQTWGKQGSDEGEFNEPIGITANEWGVYVVDSMNYRIQRFPHDTGSESVIVDEARVDIGMPYNVNRGCSSPYVGCGGPYHGFYRGVCTDLAMDAYNAGVFFNIQNVLYQDHLVNLGHYRYGTARNAEDMRRYFNYNQQLLPHGQSYQLGDIAFFDLNGDGLTDHVNVISEVDGNNRPIKMVDATGVYSGNPTGLAFEHNWSSYYDLHCQGHGRLSPIFADTSDLVAETTNFLRISINSSSIRFSVFDLNGKTTSANYDENLVASNIESFIPYIPGGSYSDTGTQKTIVITHPLSNTTQYSVHLEGQGSENYELLIETLEGSTVTDSELFIQSIDAGETQRAEIMLTDVSGTIEFTSTSPSPSPLVNVPYSLTFAGLVGTSAQLTFNVAEVGGQYSINDVVIASTELSDQLGGMISDNKLEITPTTFDVTANGDQEVSVQIDLNDVLPGVYQGSLIISTQDGGSYRVRLTLDVNFHQLFLPIVIAQ